MNCIQLYIICNSYIHSIMVNIYILFCCKSMLLHEEVLVREQVYTGKCVCRVMFVSVVMEYLDKEKHNACH